MGKLTYLLVGAFGHLGISLITLLLNQGCQVRAFDARKNEDIPANPLLTCYEGDVTKPETLTPLFADLSPGSFVVVYLAEKKKKKVFDYRLRVISDPIRGVNHAGIGLKYA